MVKKRRSKGEGSIAKRKDGRWMARYYVTTPDGQRKRQQIIGSVYEKVLQQLREEQVQAQRGTPVLRMERTTGDFVQWWMDEIAPSRLRISTLTQYAEKTKNYLIPYLGKILLTSLSPCHVRTMVNEIIKNGHSPYIAWRVKMILSPMLTTAVELGYIHRNSAHLVPMKKYRPNERNHWNKNQVKSFLDYMKNHKYYGRSGQNESQVVK